MRCVRPVNVFGVACAALLAWALFVVPAGATSRIKDLANIEGVRQNQLIGYGLVVGLNGTGDTAIDATETRPFLIAVDRMATSAPLFKECRSGACGGLRPSGG